MLKNLFTKFFIKPRSFASFRRQALIKGEVHSAHHNASQRMAVFATKIAQETGDTWVHEGEAEMPSREGDFVREEDLGDCRKMRPIYGEAPPSKNQVMGDPLSALTPCRSGSGNGRGKREGATRT